MTALYFSPLWAMGYILLPLNSCRNWHLLDPLNCHFSLLMLRQTEQKNLGWFLLNVLHLRQLRVALSALRHRISSCTHRRKAKRRSRKGVQIKGSDTDDLHLGSHTLTRNCSLNLVCVCLSAFSSLISYQFPAYNAVPCMCPNPAPNSVLYSPCPSGPSSQVNAQLPIVTLIQVLSPLHSCQVSPTPVLSARWSTGGTPLLSAFASK